jgi:hypothetical protein
MAALRAEALHAALKDTAPTHPCGGGEL